MSKPLKVAVFADVNPNLIDGSTVWLQSMTLLFNKIEGVQVFPVLREDLTSDFLLKPFENDPKQPAHTTIAALDPSAAAASGQAETGPARVERALRALDARETIDLFVVRGRDHLIALAQAADIAPRLWAYWLDRPQITAPSGDPLFRIARSVAKVLTQSEFVASALESIYGIRSDKILVIPPMVPPEAWSIATPPADDCRLVYSGKLDKSYNVESYLGLPNFLRMHGLQGTVTYVGDKFNSAKDDPNFVSRMRAALESTEGVEWKHGVDRVSSLRHVSGSLFSLCWRDRRYDNSLEISTKLLESCALGVPPLLNRTHIHRKILGDDYPYYVANVSDVQRAVERAKNDRAEYDAVSRSIREVARRFSLERSREKVEHALSASGQLGKTRVPSVGKPKRRVLIAGHDFKFLADVLPRLICNEDLEIRFDKWAGARRMDSLAESERCLDWADVVFCEWCVGAAVWYSNSILPRQKCFIRLHRFEAFEPDPHKVDFSKVERLIVVSSHFRDLCAEKFGIPADRIDVFPQYVDCERFHRPKHPWAQKTLGLVGINGFFHKRPDRAFDVLASLLEQDEGWSLRVRSQMPWDIDWIWRQRPDEVHGFRQLFSRVVNDPHIRDRVIFDMPGSDMAEWFRHVGVILSTSDSEGCHTSVAEGMASGAVPSIYAWPGAESVYPASYVHESPAGMVEQILATGHIDQHRLAAERERISEEAKTFDVARFGTYLATLFQDDAANGMKP